ncbi:MULTISPECIES: hypothetical protein [unclassified Moraxella]|uniref:hypothetical protein n=1 Tax=unclassified Moraxella TaxID=2685852 RepID=UPI003AF8F1B8
MTAIDAITGLTIDYTQLSKVSPKQLTADMTAQSINYRRAFARANNAIEGVILSNEDKKFMDNIPLAMPKNAFKKAVLAHLASKRSPK